MESPFDALDPATRRQLERLSRQQGLSRDQLAIQLIREGLAAHGRLASEKTEDGLLTSRLVHELRTPAGSLLILADLIESEAAAGGAADALASRRARLLRDAASDISSLLQEISELGCLEREGTQALGRPQLADLSEMVAEVERTKREEAAARGVALEVRIVDGAADRVRSDRRLVSSVLTSLVETAIRVSSGGRVRIELASAPRGQPGAAISVTDSGPPLRDRAGLLFEPLRIADPRNRRDSGGSTLALALARCRSRLLGGDLRARSTPAGVVVTLALPLEAPGPRAG